MAVPKDSVLGHSRDQVTTKMAPAKSLALDRRSLDLVLVCIASSRRVYQNHSSILDPTVTSSQKSQTSSASPQSWEEMFDSGYKRCYDSWRAEWNESYATKDKDSKAKAQWEKRKRHRLSREGGWDSMSIVNAIATIWAPLGMRHGYGHQIVFEVRNKATQIQLLQSGSGQQSTACGQYEEKFIIPLHVLSAQEKQDLYESGESKSEFSSKGGKGKAKAQSSPGCETSPKPTSKAGPPGGGQLDAGAVSKAVTVTAKSKGKAKVKNKVEKIVGHFVLAVATKVDSKPITIQIWDSRPGYVTRAEIEEAAQGVVKYSGWMGMSLDSRVWDHEPPLEFRRTAYEKSPNQGSSNFCGLYTVLNAWANMLGIQIRRKQTVLKLPEGITLEKFHQEGTNLVNLALAGHMDSRTIQAFLRVYGYSVNQSLSKLVEDVRAIKMDDTILDECIMEKKALDDVATAQISEPYAGPWLS